MVLYFFMCARMKRSKRNIIYGTMRCVVYLIAIKYSCHTIELPVNSGIPKVCVQL